MINEERNMDRKDISNTYKEERDMAGKAISNTYKGILRISNNSELVKYTKDTFLSEDYYFKSDSDEWVGGGQNLTKTFFSDSSTGRFNFEDAYTNLKLPVTDSMGNYLNFSLGVNGTLIGNYPEIGVYKETIDFISEEIEENFPIVKTNNPLFIGLQERYNIRKEKKIRWKFYY